MNLSTLDLIIIGIPAVVVFAVTFFMRRYMKSVADFLAASRCAGRYLLCTASAETGAAIMGTVAAWEAFSKTGYSLGLWGGLPGIIFLVMGIAGVIGYRFRETRCLTFHQFFEVRYSKGTRVYASFLNVFSGLFNFGLLPGVMARFFVNFCGLPEIGTVTLPFLGLEISLTQFVVMLGFVLLSLFMAVTGGQISVMVTDCLEGLISGVFYLIIALTLFFILSRTQIEKAFLSGPPGKSFVNPFDFGRQEDFNVWYLVLGFLIGMSYYRGNAWLGGFAASAKSAHEGKMASILGGWRVYVGAAAGSLMAMGGMTLLHNDDFKPQQEAVQQILNHFPDQQTRTQMTMPMAVSQLLPNGVKGCFLAIAIFGTLAGLGASMHSFGSTFLQDVILPLKKKPFSPTGHLWALQLCALGVGLFGIFFSLVYTPKEYLVLLGGLIGAIYLGGIGACVWGGLYWKKGTAQGAKVALTVGWVLALVGWILRDCWPHYDPWLICWINPDLTPIYQLEGTLKTATVMPWINTTLTALYHPAAAQPWALSGAHPLWGYDLKPTLAYLLDHQDRSPVNALYLSFISCACAFISYVVVSLLTRQADFDMDRMLHRGKYRIEDANQPLPGKTRKKWTLAWILAIDEHYTRGDKILTGSVFGWGVFWYLVSIALVVCNLFIFRWSDKGWFAWHFITGVYLPMTIGLVTTVWFTIGATRDLIRLIRSLKVVARNDADDGTVRDHHNVGETLIMKGLAPPERKAETATTRQT